MSKRACLPWRGMLSACALLIGLSGCNFAPVYQRPQADLRPTWSANVAEPSAPQQDIPWESLYTDERLRALIRAALTNNHDVRLAVSRMEEARAQWGVQRADQVPGVSASLGRVGSLTPAGVANNAAPFHLNRVDANLNLLNNVPENVAFNKEAVKVRSLAATARVSSGLVCARCHDADADHFGFKPITNDALESQYELGSTIGDASRPGRARRANQESASNFGAELTGPLDQSRLIYQKQAHIATGYKTTRPVVFGLSEDYWGYWYDQATPVTVARDLGFNLNHDDAIRVLLAIAPSLENDPDTAGVLNETLKEDRVLARIKNGSRVTGMQWRTLFPLIAGRARQDQVREKIAVLIQERKQ